jgi:5-methyltetrahydrofolate--homocysteine methyltransferase
VASKLLHAEDKAGFIARNAQEQLQCREQHLASITAKSLLSLAEARARKPRLEWTAQSIPQPEFLGVRVLSDVPLDHIVPFVDWSPFFHTWELRGRFPRIFDDPVIGTKARELYDDAQRLLERILRERLLRAQAVYGFFPAYSIGDDIELYTDEHRHQVLARFHFLRQQMDKPSGQFNHCLADYVAPRPAPEVSNPRCQDYLGAFAVTAGHGVDQLCHQFEAEHDDYSVIMTKALADRLAEGLAEYIHKTAREQWNYGREENLSLEDLIRERYRGIRPAAGYPACPDHTEKRTLFDLLHAETNAGIHLTESFAMHPASSVSGLYFSHPEAKYFAVGKITREQVMDYSRRKQIDLKTAERWLAPQLAYEP